MVRPFIFMVITISLMPFTASCLITNQDLETLKEQVRLEQEAVVDLQRRLEERSMQIDGMENSMQMLQARVEDNAKRLEDMETMLSTDAPPAREFVLAPKEEEPASSAPPPEMAVEEEKREVEEEQAVAVEEKEKDER